MAISTTRAGVEALVDRLEGNPSYLKGLPNNLAQVLVIRKLFDLSHTISNNVDNSISKELFDQTIKLLSKKNHKKVLFFFLEHGATTQRELGKALVLDRATVSRILDYLVETLEIIKITEKVGKPYSVRAGGPQPNVYALIDAPAEDTINAQIRYGELASRSLPPGPKERNREPEIIEYVDKVLEILPEGKLSLLTPIYDALNALDVPSDLMGEVKARVVDDAVQRQRVDQ